MTDARQRRERNAAIDRAFDEALDLPDPERQAWLQRLRDRDPAMARAVERLLDAAVEPDPRLEPDAWARGRVRAALGWDPTDAPGRSGDRAGPYRIIEEIGRGGMSVVYLAERVERYQAEALLELGAFDAAAVLAGRVSDRMRALGLAGHPAALDALEIRARALMAQGRPHEAVPLLTEAINGRTRLSVPSDPRLEAARRYHARAMAAGGGSRGR